MKRKAGLPDPRVMTLGSIEEFLDQLDQQGRPVDSLDTYRRKLIALYNFLGERNRLGRDTLARWRNDLLAQGYANSTVNTFIYVANSYLNHVGLREYQLVRLPHSEPRPVEDLTRAEYLRLLSTARVLENEQVYLLVKTFALTGIAVQDLPRVTVEAVLKGEVPLEEGPLRLPVCLQEELLDFAQRSGLQLGPVFVTKRERKPLGRTVVTAYIRQLCREARVPEEKGSPRQLRRLYQNTRKEIEDNVNLLIQREQERILAREQQFIGWEKCERYGAS